MIGYSYIPLSSPLAAGPGNAIVSFGLMAGAVITVSFLEGGNQIEVVGVGNMAVISGSNTVVHEDSNAVVVSGANMIEVEDDC